MNPLHLDVGGVGGPLEAQDAAVAAVLLFLASAVPFAAGLWAAGRWRGAPGPLAGLAAGAVLFLAFDLFKESGVSVGLLRPWTLALLLGAFAVGLVAPALAARRVRAPAGAAVPAFLWALGVGAHGLGEGFVVGTDAHAIGLALPFFGGLSFVLHKAIEGATVRPLQDDAPTARQVVALALVAGLPGALGAVLGALLGPSLLGPAAFALGAGAAAWALLLLARRGDGRPAFYVAALVGAFLVLGAGLLHEL